MTDGNPAIDDAAIDRLCARLLADAAAGGYHLNPDDSFTRELARGLLVNEARYGYQACPCRLASGMRRRDRDVICPCDYRDQDVVQYGACYCALYVSAAVESGAQALKPVPERRLPESERNTGDDHAGEPPRDSSLSHPVWRCSVCGYLCAREEPPEVCPICKVKKERFERFM